MGLCAIRPGLMTCAAKLHGQIWGSWCGRPRNERNKRVGMLFCKVEKSTALRSNQMSHHNHQSRCWLRKITTESTGGQRYLLYSATRRRNDYPVIQFWSPLKHSLVWPVIFFGFCMILFIELIGNYGGLLTKFRPAGWFGNWLTYIHFGSFWFILDNHLHHWMSQCVLQLKMHCWPVSYRYNQMI